MKYFTADLHLGHSNIAGRRGFNTVDSMNKMLINNINATVGMQDELWILGDFSFKISKDEAKDLLNHICCQHIHLIRGNHDKDWATDDGWETVDDYVELKTDWGKIPLFHYPIAEWDRMQKGCFHFHGHIHGTEEQNVQNAIDGIRRYDVGVDANDLSPISLDKIITRMTDIESAIEGGIPVDFLRSNKGRLEFYQ